MKSKILGVVLGITLSMLMVVGSYAQPAGGVDATAFKVKDSIGNITSIAQGVIWISNLFGYLGWVGVFVGVGMAIFSLVYKLIQTDSEEAMKKVQGYITKAVLIVVAGILMVSFRFIILTVVKLFPSIQISDVVDTELNITTK